MAPRHGIASVGGAALTLTGAGFVFPTARKGREGQGGIFFPTQLIFPRSAGDGPDVGVGTQSTRSWHDN